MKNTLISKLIFSIFIALFGMLFSLFVNRGFMIVESIVGSEYKNIMSSEKIMDYGRLGHRILTPFFSKIFDDIFLFNVVILVIWLFYITYHLYEKYEKLTLGLLILGIASTQVVLFTFNFAYYPDPLTVLMTTIMLFNLEKNILFIFIGFLNLINNEIGLFLLLFLVFISNDKIKKIKLLGIILIMYLTYRYIINLYINNDSSGIPTYINELRDFNINFFMLFGLFSGLKFLMVFLISSKKQLYLFIFLVFYILIPLNMAVDYTRYGALLVVVVLWVLDTKSFKYNKNIKVIALLILILNVVTPKYYIWGEQVTYLRDSKLHFLDITGKNFEERNLYE